RSVIKPEIHFFWRRIIAVCAPSVDLALDIG
ncbi:MAG: hypothetical protein ACI9IV_000862, partial [Paracoccaceae bacterium]